ncbi:CPBP family glutamic-type intramembrane protease [Marinoscillum furvescens]|nr:CPBP family glutamic-type intramembrane protease [Marinoscillum furvescens]
MTLLLISLNMTFFNGAFGHRLQSSGLYESDINPIFLAVSIVLLGPVVEEITCRLPLKITRFNIVAAISCFVLLSLLPPWNELDGSYHQALIALGGAMLFGILTFILLSKWMCECLSRIEGKYLVFGLTCFFALMHLFNFSLSEIDIVYLWAAPFFVLPQFITGYFLAFIRLKINFPAAILFHMLINVPGSIHVLMNNIN